MSAKIQDTDTEMLIKDTAKNLFFSEGKFNATTQEIADAAGVNRTLINYYFRSRDALFQKVFEEAQEEEFMLTKRIVDADMPLKEKLSQHLEFYFEQTKKYPYLEIYMVTQMNQGSCYKDKEMMNTLLDKFYLEIALEMERGTIEKMRPEQFVLNFAALMSFPVSMRPLFQETMGISKEGYDRLLEERKEIILNILFKPSII